MMEVVLTRLRDFSCKTSTFDDCTPSEDSSRREAKSHSYHHRGACTAGREGSRLDIGSALAWLRMELTTAATLRPRNASRARWHHKHGPYG
ncbi:hypothetical protein AMECASPLE_034936 [Ameca splendens]|uniref:Uncharacterized protein n=1 Tax=Ameca splendens TaxID=208324 RepID=A0ABV1ADP0_9TELE